MVYEENEHTHTRDSTLSMKDKREAFLFCIIQRCAFIVQWCDSSFHIRRSPELHCDFSHSTPTHVGLGVPTSPLNPKGYGWVQEKSCNINLQSMHGSTWAESALWNFGKKRWFKDDHQHWNEKIVAVPRTLPKLARSWKLLLEELSLIKKGDLQPKRREVYYLWWF